MSSEEGIPDSFSREYPQRPIVTTVACVFREDRVLLIKRAQEPSKGCWSVPGGVIEIGEAIYDAIRREIREECGIEIEVVKVINAADGIIPDGAGRVWFHYVPIYILARYVSGEAHPGSDASEVGWVAREGLDTFDLSPITYENVIRAFDMARDLGLF
ncbi:MAG: NUDIX hydrolase [Dehalococcoidales bacterium]|nr:MAG: NUDIX hydrolase [Dehalococcoidales bacterium]